MKSEDVLEKLSYAKRRYHDLCVLIGGDLPGADSLEKQMLVQEFFFHLVGAIEYLAQLVNKERGLGIDKVSAAAVRHALPKTDKLFPIFDFIYTNPNAGQNPLNAAGIYNSDTEENLIYRIWNYRHQVVHRGRQAFFFFQPVGNTQSVKPEAKLNLDQRKLDLGPARRSVQDDLSAMFDLVESKVLATLDLLAHSPTPSPKVAAKHD